MDFFDELKQEADRILSDSQGDKNADYKKKFVQMPDEGAITLRLLPPSHGLRLPFVTTRLHKLNGKSYHCRKQLEGGKWTGKVGECTPCDHYNHLWSEINKLVNDPKPGAARKSTNPKVQELLEIVDRIKPIERFYYNCVVRDDPKQPDTKVLSIGKTIQKEIMLAFVGNKKIAAIKAMGNICDIKGIEGRDLIIVKDIKKGGNYPEYTVKFLDPSPLGTPDEIEKWIGGCYNLAELRSLKDADEMSRLLKVDLGLIEDSEAETGYDPREFTKPSAERAAPPRETRPVVAQKVEVQEVAEEPPFDPDEEDVVPDSDFLAELNDV